MIANIGIIFSIVLGFASFIYTLVNTKKSIYINTITNLRTKWLDSYKNDFSTFLGLIRSTYLYTFKNPNFASDFITINQLYYKLLLNLNPKDEFDIKIINKVNEIIILLDEDIENGKLLKLEKAISEVVLLSQQVTKIEWEGIKKETRKGELSKRDKDKLRSEYLGKIKVSMEEEKS